MELSHHPAQEVDQSRRHFTQTMLVTTGALAAFGAEGAKRAYNYVFPTIQTKGPVRAEQTELPPSFYEPSVVTELEIETLLTSEQQWQFSTACYETVDNSEVEALVEEQLPALTASLAIGYSQHLDEWIEHAQEVIARAKGIRVPESVIRARFTEPDLFSAQHSLARIARTLGAFPLSILARNTFDEYSLVETLTISGLGEEKPSYGEVDVAKKRAVSTLLGVETGKLRSAIGFDTLRRQMYVVDEDMSHTVDTYNDIEMAQIIIGPWVTQESLDDPDFFAEGVKQIAVPKVERLIELFSGKLMLPGDPDFDAKIHQQQRLLLKRLTAAYPDVPAEYYKALRRFRKSNDRLPMSQEELLAA